MLRPGALTLSLIWLATACEGPDKAIVPEDDDSQDSALPDTDIHADLPVDSDGDGVPVDDDCDDTDPAVGEATLWYEDRDGDGHGDADASELACPGSPVLVDNADDCDDDSAAVHPGADELCNAQDDDCDGEIDEDSIDPIESWPDADGDGSGDAEAASVREGCTPPEGHVDNTGDCDDSDSTRLPGATEHCSDGIDQDCDGLADCEDASCSSDLAVAMIVQMPASTMSGWRTEDPSTLLDIPSTFPHSAASGVDAGPACLRVESLLICTAFVPADGVTEACAALSARGDQPWSAEQQALLIDVLPRVTSRVVWVPVHADRETGDWSWNNGTAVDALGFAPGQPDGRSKDPFCAGMNWQDEQGWVDLSCSGFQGFECTLPESGH